MQDDIFKYRITDIVSQNTQTFLTPEYDDDGKAFVEFSGRRKTANAVVKVTKPGKRSIKNIIEFYDIKGYKFLCGVNF